MASAGKRRAPTTESGAPSLRTSVRGYRFYPARPANLRFRNLIDFSEHHGRFILQRDFHRLVVIFGIFAGAKLEPQIAQIVVKGVAPLQQLIQFRAVRRKVGRIRLDEKYEKSGGGRECQAGAKNGPIRGGDQKKRDDCSSGQDQSSVSRAARTRARSS